MINPPFVPWLVYIEHTKKHVAIVQATYVHHIGSRIHEHTYNKYTVHKSVHPPLPLSPPCPPHHAGLLLRCLEIWQNLRDPEFGWRHYLMTWESDRYTVSAAGEPDREQDPVGWSTKSVALVHTVVGMLTSVSAIPRRHS